MFIAFFGVITATIGPNMHSPFTLHLVGLCQPHPLIPGTLCSLAIVVGSDSSCLFIFDS